MRGEIILDLNAASFDGQSRASKFGRKNKEKKLIQWGLSRDVR